MVSVEFRLSILSENLEDLFAKSSNTSNFAEATMEVVLGKLC